MRTADELLTVGLLEKNTYDEFLREPDPMKIARVITSIIYEKVELNSENFAKFIRCLRNFDNKDLESLATKLEQCLSKLISILNCVKHSVQLLSVGQEGYNFIDEEKNLLAKF